MLTVWAYALLIASVACIGGSLGVLAFALLERSRRSPVREAERFLQRVNRIGKL